MTIWLIYPYGTLPNEDGWRDTRSTMFCRALAQRGHTVTWWTGSFSHATKLDRAPSWNGKEPNAGFTIRLVPTPRYKKHIGLARLYFELVFALRSYLLLIKQAPPDIIISNDPPQIPAWACRQLARRMNVPIMLDVIDLWPELFVTALPRLLQPFSRLIFWPLFAIRRSNFRQASAITAVCDSYRSAVEVDLPPATPNKVTTVFWSGAVNSTSTEGKQSESAALPNGTRKQTGEVWAIYAGMLGQRYDLDTILAAAKLAKGSNRLLRFIIAGDGPRKDQIQAEIASADLHNVLFLGRVPGSSLARLYEQCDIGLCPYSAGSTVAMPVKVFDYFAAGLPIVSSLEGDIKELLRDSGAGLKYEAGNPKSLLDCLRELTESSRLRSLMAQRSKSLAERFDTGRQYTLFADIVERVVHSHTGRHKSLSMTSSTGR